MSTPNCLAATTAQRNQITCYRRLYNAEYFT
jgi:hypothetical protein